MKFSSGEVEPIHTTRQLAGKRSYDPGFDSILNLIFSCAQHSTGLPFWDHAVRTRRSRGGHLVASTRPSASSDEPSSCLDILLFPLTADQLIQVLLTMSQAPSPSPSTSSSNFQSVFNAALKAYERKTKKNILLHPLAEQLQACKSPDDILAILQDNVKEFEQSMSADERLSRWLNPTINVLYAFSATLGAGVGVVSPIKLICLSCPININFARCSPPQQRSFLVLGSSSR